MGERTLADVCRLAELESGLRDDEFAVLFFELLARLDLATLEPVAG